MIIIIKMIFLVILFITLTHSTSSSISSSSLPERVLKSTLHHNNYTSISDFRVVNRRYLLDCSVLSPDVEIKVSPNKSLPDDGYITVNVTGISVPNDLLWVAMISPSHSKVTTCLGNAAKYIQTGDLSSLPLLCHYPVKVGEMAKRSDKGKAQVSNDPLKEIKDPDTRPFFIHDLLPVNLFYLKLPQDFIKILLNENTWLKDVRLEPPDVRLEATDVRLKTPLGSFMVNLEIEGDDFYLTDGWQKFVEEHLLGDYDHLFIKLDPYLEFDVDAFQKNGFSNFDLHKKNHSGNSTSSYFTSTFPYFQCTIKAMNLGNQGYVEIPKDFSRKNNIDITLGETRRVLLQNSNQIHWPVYIETNMDQEDLLMIRRGWKEFAVGNFLKKDDVCIFEFVRNGLMIVKIFRQYRN